MYLIRTRDMCAQQVVVLEKSDNVYVIGLMFVCVLGLSLLS